VIEVVDSPELRMQGLSGRKSLAEDRGMLFVFDKEGMYAFWMKDMLIALDIIWLDSNKKIIGIIGGLTPCVDKCKPIYSPGNILYALEVNSGFSKRHQLKVGEALEFRN